MRKLRLLTWTIVTALLVTGSAHAAPQTCRVILDSPDGGRLEVTRIDPSPASPDMPFALPGGTASTWHPPASDAAIDLQMVYNGRDLDSIGELADVLAEFSPSKGTSFEQYTAEISSDGLRGLHLEGAGVNVKTRKYSLSFQWGDAGARTMGRALDRGARVNVTIMKADAEIQSEVFNGTRVNLSLVGQPKAFNSGTFDTSGIAARDKLFAQARHLIESDPTVCKPTDAIQP